MRERKFEIPSHDFGLDAACPATESVISSAADFSTPHPLGALAIASRIRLANPRLEHARKVLLEGARVVGRDVAHALDRGLSQALAEYRGSRQSGDLEATTAELRTKLEQCEETIRTTSDRLVTLMRGRRLRGG
jgi:hypothetical protein